MLDVLLWLLAAEAVGFAALPLAYALFPFLSDRGYALGKALGILLLTYGVWLLGTFHILPATRWSILLVLLLLALGSGAVLLRRSQEIVAFLRRERATLLVTEAVFLVLYLAWVAYRAYDPAINHTEQPMEFAFLNASLRTRFFPPEDPWLAGYPISYYYLGHLMMATLAKLTGILPAVAYNLALALMAALAGAAAFSLVTTLVSGFSREAAVRRTWAFGLLGVVLLVVVSNLLGVLEGLRLRGFGSPSFWQWLQIKGLEGPNPTGGWFPQEHWWWFRSTRIVDTLKDGQSLDLTINEFPFFSFLLGDLHPHMMALPFVLLVLGFCLNFLRDPTVEAAPYSWRRLPFLAALALALGALGFLNFADLATFTLVVAGALFLRFLMASPQGSLLRTGLRALPLLGLVLPLAWLLYVPFYTSYSSQASGVLPVDEPVTRYIHFLIIWGLFLVPVVAMTLSHLVSLLRQDRRLTFNAVVALGVVGAPFLVWALANWLVGEPMALVASRLAHLLPFLALGWASLYGVLEGARQQAPVSLLVTLGLVFMATMLLMGPELFYVLDVFHGRYNTVFKLYYQAWVLLALASASGLYYWQGQLRRAASGWRLAHSGGWALFFLLLAGSLYYPVAASYSKAGGFQGSPTLDGLAYVKGEVPGEYEAIRELQARASPGARMIEAVGGEFYIGAAYGRMSSGTGIPTLLEWEGHELQWRGSSKPMEGRRELVDRIYSTVDAAEAEALLAQHSIEYVVVGPREVSQYGLAGMEKFDAFMDRFFSQDGFVIYMRAK